MLFAIRITDKPGMGATRRATRDAHIAYLAMHAPMLILAGPILDDAGDSIGSVRLVEAEDRAAAEKLCAEDPFALAGCFARVEIDPYRIVFRDGRLVE